MSRRRLTDDEQTLWQGVARSVSPLRKRLRRTAVPEPVEVPKAVTKPSSKLRVAAAKAAPVPPAPSPRPAAPPPLAPLGRKLKQRIARGSHAIDGRLDLHGFTQAQAHSALLHFLGTRQARGAKVVLVITGKGFRGDGGVGERGVLRRMVPLWLGLPEFRDYVIGFEAAGIGHGGDGALYVSLRKSR